MVLVDTCIWIFSLAGREPYGNALRSLLHRDEVARHDFIYGELMIGDNDGRKGMLADYLRLQHVPTVPHQEVMVLVEARRLHGIGLSWIDAHLLASSLVSQMRLWTADASLAAVAKDLGVAYQP